MLDVWIPRPGPLRDHLARVIEPGVRLVSAPPARILIEGTPTEEELASCPDLAAVIVPYAGVPARTLELLDSRPRVALHNLHHNAEATAEMALALLLGAAKSLVPGDRELRAGNWRRRSADCEDSMLAGGTAVVLGRGAIGSRVAARLKALGMEVLERGRGGEFRTLLPRTRALLLCLPLTAKTRGLIGAPELALLPRGAILVNVSRGPIVAEQALYGALREGRLRAGIDVWYRYPEGECTAPGHFPFEELDNIVMSPHRAGHAAGIEPLRAEHLARLLNAAARCEEIPNLVDRQRGY